MRYLIAIIGAIFLVLASHGEPVTPSSPRASAWLDEFQSEQRDYTDELAKIRVRTLYPIAAVEKRALEQDLRQIIGSLLKVRQDLNRLSTRKFQSREEDWYDVLQQARSLNDINLENALDLQYQLRQPAK